MASLTDSKTGKGNVFHSVFSKVTCLEDHQNVTAWVIDHGQESSLLVHMVRYSLGKQQTAVLYN